MKEFTLTEADCTRDVDLGESRALVVNNLAGALVQVYIDYNLNGVSTSAVKASAGYTSPFTLQLGDTKVVEKGDLESEHVRVTIEGVGAKIKFVY